MLYEVAYCEHTLAAIAHAGFEVTLTILAGCLSTHPLLNWMDTPHYQLIAQIPCKF